ncbi:hypothetical protein HanOQP8_Chr11g0423491 [Helianthus annuus]|nr:hypothetical protein HanOQP8_Chr11g0423491 [Helianthus annuus]
MKLPDVDIRMARPVALEKGFPSREDYDIVDDPRLRRVAPNRLDNKEEVRADHRRIQQAEIISPEELLQRKQEEAAMTDEGDS